jgi:hypothetical protein
LKGIYLKPHVHSTVPKFEGPAVAVWLNPNRLDHRLDGGVTGFFRCVKKIVGVWWVVGPEFHGIVRCPPGGRGKIVESSEVTDDHCIF